MKKVKTSEDKREGLKAFLSGKISKEELSEEFGKQKARLYYNEDKTRYLIKNDLEPFPYQFFESWPSSEQARRDYEFEILVGEEAEKALIEEYGEEKGKEFIDTMNMVLD